MSALRPFPLGEDYIGHRQTQSTSNRKRKCHLLSVSHTSTVNEDPESPRRRIPIDFEVYIEVSAWLAWYHYAAPRNLSSSNDTTILLPEVYERLSTCPVDFAFSMRDTQFSALGAAQQLLDAYQDIQTSSNDTIISNVTQGSLEESSSSESSDRLALIGTVRSVESSTMSFLAAAYGIPQIASTATAAYLDQKDAYPLFSRTVPTNLGDAQAMAVYLHSLQVTHVGIMYISDGYGIDFHRDLVKELATTANATVYSVQYDDTSVEAAIDQLASFELHYFIAILIPGAWQHVVQLASQKGIIGQADYFWLFSESSLEFVDPGFELSKPSESNLALAIHGSAVLSAMEPDFVPFDQALFNYSESEELQQIYVNQHVVPDLFDNFTFSLPGPSLYQYLSYDAVVAMMLAVCEMPYSAEDTAMDWGRQVYEQILQTEFQGVSGLVAFDPTTGTRRSQNIRYNVQNLVLADDGNESTAVYRFHSDISSVINLDGIPQYVDHRVPFVYNNNSTTPPAVLPPITVDLNLIPTGARAFGLSLGAGVMLMSLWWLVWTFLHKDKDVVKSSQPIFLSQLCIGTFLIASGVIPMSLQEPIRDHGLDIACMATPWLISVGFVTAIAALFSKTWRLNKLMKHSRNYRRVAVRPRDVARPFFGLLLLNVAVLLAWTLDAPLVWERSPVANYDSFGRSVESVGLCQSAGQKYAAVYPSLICILNLSVLVFALYQAYVARNLPTEFSESTYIGIAMALLLEVVLISVPILFLASDDPTVVFLVRSILATVSALSILLPVFLPKFIQRNANERYREAHERSFGDRPKRSSVLVSFGGGGGASALSGDFQDPSPAVLDEDPLPNATEKGTLTIRRNSEYFKERLSVTFRENEAQRNVVCSSSNSRNDSLASSGSSLAHQRRIHSHS
jgi:7 transmembrane sweet-taste receptor of 3 GCPR/Receptor family ligand binding region